MEVTAFDSQSPGSLKHGQFIRGKSHLGSSPLFCLPLSFRQESFVTFQPVQEIPPQAVRCQSAQLLWPKTCQGLGFELQLIVASLSQFPSGHAHVMSLCPGHASLKSLSQQAVKDSMLEGKTKTTTGRIFKTCLIYSHPSM